MLNEVSQGNESGSEILFTVKDMNGKETVGAKLGFVYPCSLLVEV